MKSVRMASAAIACAMLLSVTAAFGAAQFQLYGKRMAVIENGKLYLTDGREERTPAPPGIYDTRDGKYRFIVKDGGMTIRDNTQVPR